MAFRGFNGGRFLATGDTNRDGFTDHVVAKATPTALASEDIRAALACVPVEPGGAGFADLVIGTAFVACPDPAPDGADEDRDDHFAVVPEVAGGIFVG